MTTAGYFMAGVEVIVEGKCMPDDNTGRITHWQCLVRYWQIGTILMCLVNRL
jgi:hypothetical protein